MYNLRIVNLNKALIYIHLHEEKGITFNEKDYAN